MWLKLRKTTSRGRAAMPSTCWRMRRCRRFRRAFRSSRFSIAALLALHLAGAGGGPSRLARFELGPFAGVAGGLALVGLGWPPRSYARRPLANQFAVDAGHDDAAGGRHLEGDPLGRGNLHRMRVADGERQVAPLLGGTVAHALDLQLDPVPVGDAAHHIGQQCPGGPVQGTLRPLVRGSGAHPRAAPRGDARERGPPPWAVAQRDAQDPLRAALDALRVGDEALLLENARDLPLQPAPRHLDVVLPRRVRVANARQHVRDRICDYAAHYCLLAGVTSWTTTPGISPRCANCRRQMRQR